MVVGMKRSNSQTSQWIIPVRDSDLMFIIIPRKTSNNLGITIQNHHDHVQGKTVTGISRGSIYAEAGLKVGDVIRTINSRNVTKYSIEHVESIIEESERLILGIVRHNCSTVKRNFTVPLKIESPSQSCGFSFLSGDLDAWPRFEGDNWCYISEVTRGGLAESRGLCVGDTMVSADGTSFHGLTQGDILNILKSRLMRPQGTSVTVQRTLFEEQYLETTKM